MKTIILISVLLLVGCGTRLAIIETESGLEIRTNYRGSFEVKYKGYEIKGKSSIIEYPTIPPLLQIGVKKEDE